VPYFFGTHLALMKNQELIGPPSKTTEGNFKMKTQWYSLTVLVLLLALFSAESSFAQFRGPPSAPNQGPGRDDRRDGRDDSRDDRRDDRGNQGYDRLQTLYRLYNGSDHMMSLSTNEGAYQGYRVEGSLQVFADPGRTRSTLFRCFTGVGHFASTDVTCEGQQNDGPLGFIEPVQTRQANRSLYRCSGRNGDHLITADVNECYRAQYRVEFVLGFIP
jgi:hypothetical protein